MSVKLGSTTTYNGYKGDTKLENVYLGTRLIVSYSSAWKIDLANYYNTTDFGLGPNVVVAGMHFTPTGENLILHLAAVDNHLLISCNLLTPWDVSTFEDPTSWFYVTESNSNQGVFSSDGTKFYEVYYSAGAYCKQWNLSTAWDITTMVEATTLLTSIAGQAGAVVLKNDGTSIYFFNVSSGIVYQYDMSTAYDLSTATYANKSFDYSVYAEYVYGAYMSPDNNKIFINSYFDSTVYGFNLSTPGDISTAVYYRQKDMSSDLDGEFSSCLAFNPNGKKLYVLTQYDEGVLIYGYVIPE